MFDGLFDSLSGILSGAAPVVFFVLAIVGLIFGFKGKTGKGEEGSELNGGNKGSGGGGNSQQ